jgi:N-acetylglutamate synthase-like GNAT family acetyltransferase
MFGGTRIRKARREDCFHLTRIAHDAKRSWGYPEKLIRLWSADLTVTPEFVARHPVYCAVRDSNVVGFYALSGDGATRELEQMWVVPQHMGSGVGRLLFRHLCRHLSAAGVKRLRIASDPNAEGFYRRMGATRIGEEPSRPAGRSLPVLVLTFSPR